MSDTEVVAERGANFGLLDVDRRLLDVDRPGKADRELIPIDVFALIIDPIWEATRALVGR